MEQAVATLRRFNRFYTRFAGVLEPRYMATEMSLAEARVLYEIANRDEPVAADLLAELDIDRGYLSRILRRFEGRGWIDRARDADARRRPIALTVTGREAFAQLDARTNGHVVDRLARIPASDRLALVAALDMTRALLGGDPAAPWSLRSFLPGDMGLIAARQTILYAAYGWGRGMEALQNEVVAAFLRDFQPAREQCWVAERGGVMAGSIFLVDAGDGVAKLRLLYVEPWARGLGIGAALVDQCIAFAREAGYRRITLWTHTVLESARRIYEAKGFFIAEVAMHEEFGKPEQGETWTLDLV